MLADHITSAVIAAGQRHLYNTKKTRKLKQSTDYWVGKFYIWLYIHFGLARFPLPLETLTSFKILKLSAK